MKLLEIFDRERGRGVDRGADVDWHHQIITKAVPKPLVAKPTLDAMTGFWLVSKDGKQLAGPFTTIENAARYKEGRPDRVPTSAVVKQM